jgi:light-regulated signal transduction histidine kinase (bacteriophytochrome)
MGRKQLDLVIFNMNELIESVYAEVKNAYPERNIILKLAILPKVKADRAMMRQVWVNLIGNAVKFSRNREVTKIEIGSYADNAGTVYWIKDNGAGFDMNYADKLFKVFQRLHSGEEFEGTGVGLSLACRIVERHGGKIWAEAKPDSGACFFFMLPKNEN